MSFQLQASFIRVLFLDGPTAGAGFQIAPGLAVTCAHVVMAAKGGPGEKVAAAAYNGESHFISEVLNTGWSPESLNDVAFLVLF